MRTALIFALALFSATPALAEDASAPSLLPGGAASLSEEHGDWTVSCRVEGATKLCALSQALAEATTGERVVAVELATPAIDQVEGMLLLPFGMRFADGLVLKVDSTPLGTNRSYLTCIVSGCLVPVAFNASEVSALRAGKQLSLNGTRANTGQPVEFTLSLAGFSVASNRSVELSN